MLQLTNLEKIKTIKNTLKNSNLEFEVRVLSDINPISQENFVHVIKKINKVVLKMYLLMK